MLCSDNVQVKCYSKVPCVTCSCKGYDAAWVLEAGRELGLRLETTESYVGV